MEQRFDLLPKIAEFKKYGLKFAEWKKNISDYGVYSDARFGNNRYIAHTDKIIVLDLLIGVMTTLHPTQTHSITCIKSFACLNANHGIALYRTPNKTCLSAVSLKLKEERYELVGDSYCLLNRLLNFQDYANNYLYDKLWCLSGNSVGVQITDDSRQESVLDLLNVDLATAKIDLQKTFILFHKANWLTVVNEKIVFAQFKGFDYIESMCFCDENGLLEKIENSAISFDSRLKRDSGEMMTHSIDHSWHEDKLFVMSNLCGGSHTLKEKHFVLFELSLGEWLEIRLNSPLMHAASVGIDVGRDGVLTTLNGEKSNEKENECTYYYTVYKCQLRNPEKLVCFAWSKIQECKLDTMCISDHFPGLNLFYENH